MSKFEIMQHDGHEVWPEGFFSLSFRPADFEQVEELLVSAGHRGVGYCYDGLVAAILINEPNGDALLERLDFNSEHSLFCVDAESRDTLEQLVSSVKRVFLSRNELRTAIGRMPPCGNE